jgi:hypothetical protein
MLVHGVVKASVISPDRAFFTSARRAAKQLALAQRLSAVYAWSCPGCGRIQDRADPQQCCARPRAMLAVALPERRHLLAHPALPPGGSVPRWLSAAPSAPAGLSASGLDDLAALALRRAYERIRDGDVGLRIWRRSSEWTASTSMTPRYAGAGAGPGWPLDQCLSDLVRSVSRHLDAAG